MRITAVRHSRVAVLFAGAVLVALAEGLLVAVFGRGPVLVVLPWAEVVAQTFAILAALSISYVLLGRYRVLGEPGTLWLALGFWAYAIFALLGVLVHPGVVNDSSVLSIDPRGAGWPFHYKWTVFGLLLGGGALAPAPSPGRHAGRLPPLLFVAVGAAGTTLGVLTSEYGAVMPPLLDGRRFTALNIELTAALTIVFAAGALASLRRWLSEGQTALGYTASLQAVVAMRFGTDVVGGEVYDIVWYVNHVLPVAWFSFMLFALLAEYVALLDRACAEREELRRSEAMVRAFLESAAQAIVIVDPRGRISLVNAKAEAMFGYPRVELLGQAVEILVPERFREAHAVRRAAFVDLSPSAPTAPVQRIGRRRDGSEFPLELTVSAIGTEHGEFATAFVTDITERLALQQLTRQSEKLAAVGTLCAGIAHEINNPVGIIASRVELMLEDAEKMAPATSEDLRVIHRQSQRVARIASALLSFARQSPVAREPLDLNRLVEETLVLVDKQAARERITIVRTLAPGLPRLLGEANALQQVILNLVTNAREAMPGGGEVRITTGVAPGRPGHVQLVVADTGSGIPDDVIAKIYDPFFTTKPRGTGLGLSVTYGIVREHQGAIDADSEPGRGSRFTVTLPALVDDRVTVESRTEVAASV